MQGLALRQGHADGYDEEEGVEADHAEARSAERSGDSKAEEHEQNGELDKVDGDVVRALNCQRDLVTTVST